MHNDRARISVIIPTLDEESRIVQAVRSVGEADEVIVVDGGSRDATCEIVSRLPCRLMYAPRGRGSQLKVGAAQATGDLLLFLHADCWLGPKALEQIRLLARRHRNRPLFGAFYQRIDHERSCYRWLERGNAARVSWCRLPYGDQGVFIDRETYQSVGEFAEVPLMEDVVLARAVRKSCRPVLLPGPIHLSPRRWQEDGVVRRTVRNWLTLMAFHCGVPLERLVRWYG